MIITEISVDGYEEVLHGVDKETGLDAYIAVHNTKLGPALGGCRYYPYKTSDEQLNDTLRLAKGMTYKNALAGLDLGGGKATINALPEKSPELWQAFAGLVNNLYGKYRTSGDIGTTIQDLKEIKKHTDFVCGQDALEDSGVATAYALYKSIQSLSKFLYGIDSLKGKTIAIQGLGKVGKRLIEFCSKEDVKFIVTDIDKSRLKKQPEDPTYHPYIDISYVEPNEIYEVECDIFSPCAIGGILNDKTIPKLRCKGIAGSANNQLETDEHAEYLREKNIYYVPDYLANCGGVIIVEKEEGNNLIDLSYKVPLIRERLDQIYYTVFKVLYQSVKTNQTTTKICNDLAEKRFL
jgi:leucine dehydrogenase